MSHAPDDDRTRYGFEQVAIVPATHIAHGMLIKPLGLWMRRPVLVEASEIDRRGTEFEQVLLTVWPEVGQNPAFDGQPAEFLLTFGVSVKHPIAQFRRFKIAAGSTRRQYID